MASVCICNASVRLCVIRALSAGQRESLNALNGFQLGMVLPMLEWTPASLAAALERRS